jgi:hypothetical protein
MPAALAGAFRRPRNALLPWALIAVFLGFASLCCAIASFGFLDEDFAWLFWARSVSWESVLSSHSNTIFRPLAANLPYFFLSGSPAGVLGWKLSALLLAFASCFAHLLGAWGKPQAYAFFLSGLLLLLSPYWAFGLNYLNAFDYVLFPFLATAYLRSLGLGKMLWAQIFLLLALFAKEQAILLPIFSLLHPPKGKKAWGILLAGTALVELVFFLSHGGFGSHGDGQLVGFSLQRSWGGLADGLAKLARFSAFGETYEGWGRAWAMGYWLMVLWLFAELAFLREARALKRALLALGLALVFFAPLALAKDLAPYHHGVTFFLLLGECCVVAITHLPPAPLRRAQLVLALLCLVAAALWLRGFSAEAGHYRARAALYAEVLRQAEPLLAPCGQWNRVVTQGLPEALGHPNRAEYALWALRWRHPTVRFYALKTEGLNTEAVIPPHRLFWVSEHQAKGHPSLLIRRGDAGLEVSGNAKEICEKSEPSP